MKKFVKILLLIFIILIILFVPLMINILFKYDFNIWWLESEWSAGDALNFYAGILSFLGTIILGIVSIWQTKKANNISEQLLKKDLLETTDFIQLENKFEASFKHNNNTKITLATHHKFDYGTNILIEPYGNNVKELNEYLIKLYFTNSSDKNHIKKIELESFMCVQDSDEGGLFWADGSDSPVPISLDIEKKTVYINWISNDNFYVQFKVYCEPGKCFDSMMQNKIKLCFIFNLDIYSFSDVKTEMQYKMWISKEKEGSYNVINTNSTIKENKVIKSNT